MNPAELDSMTPEGAQLLAESDWVVFQGFLEVADKEMPCDGPASRWAWALSAFESSYKGRRPLFDTGHAWQHRRPAMVQIHPASEPYLPVRPVADAREVMVQLARQAALVVP